MTDLHNSMGELRGSAASRSGATGRFPVPLSRRPEVHLASYAESLSDYRRPPKEYSPEIMAARKRVEDFVLEQTTHLAGLQCFHSRKEVWDDMPNGSIVVDVAHQRGTSCHYPGTNQIKIKVPKRRRGLSIEDRARTSHVVLHELCHAYTPGEHHGPGFRQLLCEAAREAYGIDLDPDERGPKRRRNRAYELDDLAIERIAEASPAILDLVAPGEGESWRLSRGEMLREPREDASVSVDPVNEGPGAGQVAEFKSAVAALAKELGIDYRLLTVRPAGIPIQPTGEDAMIAEDVLGAFIMQSEDANELNKSLAFIKDNVDAVRKWGRGTLWIRDSAPWQDAPGTWPSYSGSSTKGRDAIEIRLWFCDDGTIKYQLALPRPVESRS